MPATSTHPTAAALVAYGQGKLSAVEMLEIESHLATCASCGEALAATPDDTLLIRAREAATSGFRAREQTVATKRAAPQEIPQPLRDHPRYRVLGLIGAGGMGAVYKAEHRLMERLVALKVINPALVSSPAALERFEREVKTAAKLSHKNIVVALDAEQAGDLHYLVMEFVEGLSLDRFVATNGPLMPQVAAGLMIQAAQGLQHAHEKGMIHRDIKPQNLMLQRDGILKILDFGLARLATQAWQSSPEAFESAERPEDATRAGALLGTPDYIAPEQASDAHQADIRADIYSLGCTLYFLLTGEPPFSGGTVFDKVHAHQTCTPTPIRLRRPEVSAELISILEKMLAKNPADRFARPADLAKALKPIAQAKPVAIANAPIEIKVAPQRAPAVLAAPEPIPPPFALPVISKPQPTSHNNPRQAKAKSSPVHWLGVSVAAALIAAAVWTFMSNGTQGGNSGKQEASVRSSPAVSSPKKVLMLLPQNDLFYPDYYQVREGLKQQSVQLVTAAVRQESVGLNKLGPQQPVMPDKAISEIKSKDYDAIVFVGADSPELCRGAAGQQVKRLLNEFQAAKKPICALCAGQQVPAYHGIFKAGTRVAGGQYVRNNVDFKNCAATVSDKETIVVDKANRLITGQEYIHGADLAREISQMIGQ